MKGRKAGRRYLNICQRVEWFFIESEMCLTAVCIKDGSTRGFFINKEIYDFAEFG